MFLFQHQFETKCKELGFTNGSSTSRRTICEQNPNNWMLELSYNEQYDTSVNFQYHNGKNFTTIKMSVEEFNYLTPIVIKQITSQVYSKRKQYEEAEQLVKQMPSQLKQHITSFIRN